jgi:5-methylcytosine-specific restriction protein A
MDSRLSRFQPPCSNAWRLFRFSGVAQPGRAAGSYPASRRIEADHRNQSATRNAGGFQRLHHRNGEGCEGQTATHKGSPMALATLKPRLTSMRIDKVPMLEAKAGTTPRIRGRAWMQTRERVALAHGYRCVDCNCVWVAGRDQMDHDVPLEQGGSNEDSNLRPRCITCAHAKTAAEAAARAGR